VFLLGAEAGFTHNRTVIRADKAGICPIALALPVDYRLQAGFTSRTSQIAADQSVQDGLVADLWLKADFGGTVEVGIIGVDTEQVGQVLFIGSDPGGLLQDATCVPGILDSLVKRFGF